MNESHRPIFYTVRQKSNPLSCFVNISTTNLNFFKKIYVAVAISHSCLHVIVKLCYIITTFH